MRKTNNEGRVYMGGGGLGGGALDVVARARAKAASVLGRVRARGLFSAIVTPSCVFLPVPRRKHSEHKLQTLSYFSPKKGF